LVLATTHPGRAWPAGTRLPPGPLLVVAEGAGAAAGLAFVAAVAAVGRGRGAGPGQHGRRGWARRRDLRPLVVGRPAGGRLTLGYLRGGVRPPLLAAERRASVVVLGPSQSGKTRGLAIPAVLEWDGPVIATSVKRDLVRDTIEGRRRRGPTWVFDPTGSTGLPATTWSPLGACTTWQGARRTAAWLCTSSRANPGAGSGEEDFWYAAAGKLLAPYLFAAALKGADMGQVVRWIDAQADDEVAAALAWHGDALGAASASWQRDERTRSSVFTTAEMVLEAFADPAVLASAATSVIDGARLLDGSAPTLYVCAPGHEQERLRPVFATLLHTVITAAYDAGELARPLLIVLDEAANIAPLRDLDAIASTAAGHGIQLVTVWQDLAQVRARYGERASTVINNHRAKLVLSGISDTATLEYASRLIGEADVPDHSLTIDATGGRSTTRSRRQRPLAPDADLRRIRPGEGVLVYGHLPPARVRLRPFD
jgi:type IV secretion system protein VirD4